MSHYPKCTSPSHSYLSYGSGTMTQTPGASTTISSPSKRRLSYRHDPYRALVISPACSQISTPQTNPVTTSAPAGAPWAGRSAASCADSESLNFPTPREFTGSEALTYKMDFCCQPALLTHDGQETAVYVDGMSATTPLAPPRFERWECGSQQSFRCYPTTTTGYRAEDDAHAFAEVSLHSAALGGAPEAYFDDAYSCARMESDDGYWQSTPRGVPTCGTCYSHHLTATPRSLSGPFNPGTVRRAHIPSTVTAADASSSAPAPLNRDGRTLAAIRDVTEGRGDGRDPWPVQGSADECVGSAHQCHAAHVAVPRGTTQLPGEETPKPLSKSALRRARKAAAKVTTPEDDAVANHYKVKLCENYMKNGRCRYGRVCRFAHGERDLRTYAQNVHDGITSVDALKEYLRVTNPTGK